MVCWLTLLQIEGGGSAHLSWLSSLSSWEPRCCLPHHTTRSPTVLWSVFTANLRLLCGLFRSTAETLPTVFLQLCRRCHGRPTERLTYCHHRSHQHPYGQRLSCMACAARVTGPVADLQRSLPCAGTRQNILSLKLVASNWSYLSTISSRAPVLAAPPLRCGRPPRPSGT